MLVPWKGTWRNFWRRYILKACFREGLDNHLYVFLLPGNDSTSVAQYTNYVLCLDGSDFVVEEMDEECARDYPAPFPIAFVYSSFPQAITQILHGPRARDHYRPGALARQKKAHARAHPRPGDRAQQKV